MRLALINPSIVAKAPAAGKPNRLTKMKQSNRSNAPHPGLPPQAREGKKFCSGNTDPDARREGIEDDPRSRLWKEISRFLGHHLARASDVHHVRNRGGPQQEGRLAGSRLQAIEQRRDVP